MTGVATARQPACGITRCARTSGRAKCHCRGVLMQRTIQMWSTLARALARTVGLSLALSWCLASPSSARAADATRALPATAVVRFDGTSTLHDFGGQLPAL